MITRTAEPAPPVVPNHHADHPGFSGVVGLAAGCTMVLGRGAVSRLAADLGGVGPGATGLASHGWTEAQAEAFATACRTAGFRSAGTDRRRTGRSTQLVVTATA